MTEAGLGERYVGAHPMSGTEQSGFAASSAELMQGVPWAVTVTPATDPDRCCGCCGWSRGRLAAPPRC